MGAMDLDQVLSHRDEINERLLRVVDAAVSPVGPQGQPHRDQGHRAAGGSCRGDGPPDEGRARQAAEIPSSRRPAPIGNFARRGREAIADPASRRTQGGLRSAMPRRASVPPRRKPRPPNGQQRHRQRRCRRAELLHRRQVHQGVRPDRRFHRTRKSSCCPIEATGVLGSLGGIAEIAKATFGEGGSASAPRRPPTVPNTNPKS